MAGRSRFRAGAVWIVALSLIATVGTGHSVGVAYSLPKIAPIGLTAGDRDAGAVSSGGQDAAGAGGVWPPVALASQSHLLLLRDGPIQLQMPEGVNQWATQSGAFLAANQGLDMRDALSIQPVIAFAPRDDWTLFPTASAQLIPSDGFSAGANSRGALGETGRLLAQGQPPSEAPSEEAREADLAKQLANPISSLISVPFQSNFNFGIGPTQGGFQYLLNIQPVVPFSLNETWNFITRMIMPVIYQNEIFPGAGSQFGLGDTTFQLFFSPKEPTKNGIIWGVGPTLFVPTGTDPLLSARTWGAGLDGVALTQIPQKGGVWTAGILASQTWSVAGPATINSLFLQPFVAFTFPNTVTINLQSQATYSWNQSQWTVPIIASVSKIFKFGDQLTSLGLGVKYYPVSPVGAPTWGLQATVTLLFPNR